MLAIRMGVLGVVMLFGLFLPLIAHGQSSPVWNGTADIQWYTANPAAQEYEISTSEQLAGLVELVNSEEQNFSSRTILLTRNLLLNDTTQWHLWGSEDGNGDTIVPARVWQPIGYLLGYGNSAWTTEQSKSFQGVFDGQGHKVVGMFVSRHAGFEAGWGLFGHINGATVRNLELTASMVLGNYLTGSFVGHSAGGLVENVINRGHVTGINEVGGLVGNNKGTIRDSYNYGDVHAIERLAGGVVGYNDYGTIQNSHNFGTVLSVFYSGGIVGHNSDGWINSCQNSGQVQGAQEVGGLVAFNTGRIDSSHNQGAINFVEPSSNIYYGPNFFGGVVGINRGTVRFSSNDAPVAPEGIVGSTGGIAGSNEGTIFRCGNRGSVSYGGSAAYMIGGVAGENRQVEENLGVVESFNEGNVFGGFSIGGLVGDNTGSVARSFNRGMVTGDSDVGGLFGSNTNSAIQNVYNQGDVKARFAAGGIAGYLGSNTAHAYNTGSVTGDLIRMAPTTYTLSDTDNGAMQKRREQFTNGELARLLQGDQDSIVWGHSGLGIDEFPRLAWEDSLVRQVFSLGFSSSNPDHQQQQSLVLSHPIEFPDLHKVGYYVVWKDSAGRDYGPDSILDGDVLLIAHWQEVEEVSLVEASDKSQDSVISAVYMRWEGPSLHLRFSQVRSAQVQVVLMDVGGRVFARQIAHVSPLGEAQVVFAQVSSGARVVVVQRKW